MVTSKEVSYGSAVHGLRHLSAFVARCPLLVGIFLAQCLAAVRDEVDETAAKIRGQGLADGAAAGRGEQEAGAGQGEQGAAGGYWTSACGPTRKQSEWRANGGENG